MKFIVCGDSWFSSVRDFPDESFAEQLCARHDWNLVSLARGGCSNFAIALQINRAIEMGAEFIVAGATTADRIEIPIKQQRFEDIRDVFNWSKWSAHAPKHYVKHRGIDNVKYKPHPDISSDLESLKDPTILSESINNLAFQENNYFYYEQEFSDQRADALKQYLVHLYDEHIKRQYDSWCLSDALRRLQASKIPFLFFTYPIFENEWYEDIAWVDKENLVFKYQFDYFNLPYGPARFHTSVAGATQFADYIQSRLKQRGLL